MNNLDSLFLKRFLYLMAKLLANSVMKSMKLQWILGWIFGYLITKVIKTLATCIVQYNAPILYLHAWKTTSQPYPGLSEENYYAL